jgi:hypothetical protein
MLTSITMYHAICLHSMHEALKSRESFTSTWELSWAGFVDGPASWLHNDCIHIGHTQKNGSVSKVNKECISQPTRANHTLSAARFLLVSHELPAVRFSCLLRGLFPRWPRSRRRHSVCSVLRCPICDYSAEFHARFTKDATHK